MKKRIYLDNNATTQIDPRVLDVVVDDLVNHIGNPSSTHSFGQDARNRLMKARDAIASFLKVKSQEIIFTSGATEALNMLIRGAFHAKLEGHIITSNVEHAAVYSTVQSLQANGCQATFLSPSAYGAVTPEAVYAALRPNTGLITLMAVNNETGVKTDIESIAAIAKKANVPFVVDAVALLGKELFTIPPGVSAMCFSGHKLHAPKGVGFAFIRNGFKFQPYLTGGDQEYMRRGGTENMSGIIGLAAAINLLKSELPEASRRMASLRDRLETALMANLAGVTINGQGPRVVNTSNLRFAGIDGESLLANLDFAGIAISHGSACASGALEPSRILLNMGIPLSEASGSIRISLSRFSTEVEIDDCIELMTTIITRMRSSKS